MRRPKTPPPDGFVFLFEVRDVCGLGHSALCVRAAAANDPARFRKWGDGPRAAWLVSIEEAERIKEAYPKGA